MNVASEFIHCDVPFSTVLYSLPRVIIAGIG
ncbi:hypothetical protein BU9_CDS0034 [Klebsiella phage Kpn BU9]|nr:hypothetical protein BU9_CDS0034 [Klebsiella phage Kpn BU9]